ncbi:putative aminotransferase [Anopheles sinensis]|uniref:Putative aminotransferase n=1 Tax=Anopheles sinensis TaxID=74873 RepID=A0A084WKF7_ANOSI|nr:putative aminotransferase [Anopheles sinensis]
MGFVVIGATWQPALLPLLSQAETHRSRALSAKSDLARRLDARCVPISTNRNSSNSNERINNGNMDQSGVCSNIEPHEQSSIGAELGFGVRACRGIETYIHIETRLCSSEKLSLSVDGEKLSYVHYDNRANNGTAFTNTKSRRGENGSKCTK